MKPIKPAERRVANIYTDPFTEWSGENNQPTGESLLQLNTAKPQGVGFHVYKMAPGLTTVPHRHSEDEEFLLLEGDLTDNDGTVYKVGDLVWLKKGTEHCSTTQNGCTLAVYIPKAEVAI